MEGKKAYIFNMNIINNANYTITCSEKELCDASYIVYALYTRLKTVYVADCIYHDNPLRVINKR